MLSYISVFPTIKATELGMATLFRESAQNLDLQRNENAILDPIALGIADANLLGGLR
jgi:hypothetical protein